MLLRDRKKLQTRTALIEHAVDLFTLNGFEQTTVDEIAAAAGVSERTFFRHFTSKEAVVFHELPERLEELRTALAAVPEDVKAWPAVRDTMRRITRSYTDEDPELTASRIRLWFTEPLLYAHWAELSLEWENEIATFLTTRYDRADAEVEAATVAAAIVAALRAAWRNEVLHGGDFDALVGRALELLGRGLGD